MLPWVSNNDASIEKLKQIARAAKGKFYVHCGLGRDRVNVAKRIIEAEGRNVAAGKDLLHATSFADRPDRFARGSLAHLDHRKWLIPYPNKDEMFGYILTGEAGVVISLLDPAVPEQAAWIAEMKPLFATYEIKMREMPLPANDLARAAAIAAAVKAMPGAATVIAPFTPYEDGAPKPGSGPARALLSAYGKIAPGSYASKPSWHLNHAGKGGMDSTQGIVEK